MILLFMGLPHYSLMYGMHCSSCHYRIDGGGIRKGMGRYLQTSDFPMHKFQVKIPSIGENGEIGMDARLFHMQYNRGSYLFPMQFSFFLYINLNENFDVFVGKSLISSGVEAYARVKDMLVNGSYIRLGIFPPSIGLRYEDHTLFVRDYLDDGAANYFMQRMENGALEMGYTSRTSSISLGVVNSTDNMLFSANKQAYFLNLFHLMEPGDYILLIGSSALYRNPSRYILDAYAGFGIRSRFSIIGEYQHHDFGDVATLSIRWLPDRSFHLFGAYNISGNFLEGNLYLQRYGGGISLFLMPTLEYQFRYYHQSDGNDILINGLHFMF